MRFAWLPGVLAGCASAAALPAVRFANAPAVAVVDDRRDVPKPPAPRHFRPRLYVYDATIELPIVHALDVRRDRRALGINALDEVPDSTWFTNRIGVRDLSADEITTGPLTNHPELHRPWTVRSTKIGGTTIGFIITDSGGTRYLLKFDAAGDPPELETGTQLIVNRLLWACGYNVAEDQIVYLRAEDLVLAADAVVKGADGDNIGRLERAQFERELARARHEPDGRLRALASRWIDGKNLGGHPAEGRRSDDPNDLIPHELRRDLRGLYTIYAWLDAIDVTEGQFVDSWVADPADPARHYVKHYAIDFGKSLGAMGGIDFDWWHGHAYRIDFAQMAKQLVTVGAASRPWQNRQAPPLHGVSPLFEARAFDPGAWYPDTPGYIPFLTSDRIDKFWGARIVARFTRDQIRGAVAAARLTDPRAVDYIVETLVARQRATEAYWFSRVNSLDHFTIGATRDGPALCFDDLGITTGVTTIATRYTITSFDVAARPLGAPDSIYAARDGHTCAPSLPLAPRAASDGYTILRIATTRPGFTGETFVHIARDPSSGAPRVIGIWRP
jgi:hypothetical protein